MVEPLSPSSDNVINLVELTRLLISAWKLIGGVTGFVTVVAVIYALLVPELYKAKILLAHAEEEKNISSKFSQFGGLAAMAGNSIPADSNKEHVIATLKSRKFLQRYIEENDLNRVLFENQWNDAKGEWKVESGVVPPTPEKAYNLFSDALDLIVDKKTGLVTLSVSWKDPEVAAEWANNLVRRLNEELRRKAIENSEKRIGYIEMELGKTLVKDMKEVLYSLLESEKQKAMLANVNEEFALEVIDPAVVPEQRHTPHRKLIVITGSACGFFIGIFFVFFREFLRNCRNSEKASL